MGVTLTDSSLYAGPRVSFGLTVGDAATYVTYLVNGVKVKLVYDIAWNMTTFHVDIFPTTTSTMTVVQYYYVNLDDSLDEARPTSTGSPYSVEQKFTTDTTKIWIRDTTTSLPSLNYTLVSAPDEWVLKYHPPTATSDTYYNSETLNTSTGDDLVIDPQATMTTGISPYSFG